MFSLIPAVNVSIIIIFFNFVILIQTMFSRLKSNFGIFFPNLATNSLSKSKNYYSQIHGPQQPGLLQSICHT